MQAVTVRWRYQKRSNNATAQLVNGVDDVAKTSSFTGYLLSVYSGPTRTATVLRRTVTMFGNANAQNQESYVYTTAFNIADAGSFQPWVMFTIQIQDGGLTSTAISATAHVVS